MRNYGSAIGTGPYFADPTRPTSNVRPKGCGGRRSSQGRVFALESTRSQELRRPLALKPSLGSGQFVQAACTRTLDISFRPDWQSARLAKRRTGGVAVSTRLMEK